MSPDHLYRFRCRARCASYLNAKARCHPDLLCVDDSHEAQCPRSVTDEQIRELADRLLAISDGGRVFADCMDALEGDAEARVRCAELINGGNNGHR